MPGRFCGTDLSYSCMGLGGGGLGGDRQAESTRSAQRWQKGLA